MKKCPVLFLVFTLLLYLFSFFSEVQALHFPWHQISLVSDRVRKIWHKGSLGDEDDAQTLNTRIA